MNHTKTAAHVAKPSRPTTTVPMRFRIKGAIVEAHTDGDYVICIDEMPILQIDCEAIRETLKDAGFDQRKVDEYADRFFEMVNNDVVAEYIAKNMVNVY